jgi:hypothetical protein
MSWHNYTSEDDASFRVLYKGVDIGLTREIMNDVYSNQIDVPDEYIENLYNLSIVVKRNKKINNILDILD